MKTKILLTSALAISIVCPAMSEKLPEIENCVEGEIGVSEGTASLEADWERNEISITWDGNGAEVSDGAESCFYDLKFTLPTPPERTGYTFDGWKVKSSAFDLSTLDTSIGGIDYGYQNDSTGMFGADSSNKDKYGITEDQTWATEFSYGTIKGKAVCANNGGDYAQTGTPEGTGGQYCWCQTTGFDAEKDGTYMPVSSSSWVFHYANGYADGCASDCARGCAAGARDDGVRRAALFGLVAN